MPEKPKSSSISPGLSIGGASSLAIVCANYFVSKEYSEAVTMGMPILVGVLFTLFQYGSAFFNVPPLMELRATRPIDRQISFLEKRIKEAKKQNRSQEHIDKLEAELSEQELARTKLPELYK